MSPGGQWILEAAKSQEAGSPWKPPQEPSLLTRWLKVQQNPFQTSDLQHSNVINWSYLKAVGLWALGYSSHGVLVSQSWTPGSVNASVFSLWVTLASLKLCSFSFYVRYCYLLLPVLLSLASFLTLSSLSLSRFSSICLLIWDCLRK